MKLIGFLRDKILYLLSHLLVMVLTLTLIVALLPDWSNDLAWLVGGLYLVGALAPLAVEYQQRSAFYGNLLQIFTSLDRKNLLAEMITPPSFQEGQILFDVLRQSSKASLDEINSYRFRQDEYREYIELWVHEVKTPIASSRLIAQNNPSPAMDSLSEELTRIEDFVEQALFYSRISVVEQDYLIRPVNLQDICHQVLRRNATRFIHQKVAVETENLDQLVPGDAKWLVYILNQLVGNALKYTRPEHNSPRIRLQAEKLANSTVLTVADNGLGIPAGELPRIFDKGFTGTTGRSNEKSTGMGLYICRRLGEKLGLSITAESTLGEGTAIRIFFPDNSLIRMTLQK